MCNMQACDNIFRKLSERMAKTISRCAYQFFVAYSPQTTIQQEEEGSPVVPDDKAFISTYCFLPVAGPNSPSSKDFHSGALYRNLINFQLHPTSTLFPKVSRGPTVAHSRLFEFKTPHISKFSWSCVKQKISKYKAYFTFAAF